MNIETLQLGPVGTNCFIIGGEPGSAAAVIDPGWDAPIVLDVLRRRQWIPEAVVITHAHFDHIGGVRGVVEGTGAPFLVGEHEVRVLRVAVERAMSLFGVAVPEPPEPTRLLRAGETITLAGQPFRIVHTPGHSPGHICLLGDGVAFVGDVVFQGSVGRTDLPGGSTDTLLRSIATHILTLPDDTELFNGHGPSTTVGRERRSNPFLAGLEATPGAGP